MSIEGLTAEGLAADFRAVADLVHDVENPAETTTRAGGRTGKPGSQLPPGVAEIFHAADTDRALAKAYDLSAYVAGVIVERSGELLRPSSIDGAQVLVDMTYDAEGRYIVYGIVDDLRAAREALGSVVRRYHRVIQTGRACLDLACAGRYEVRQHDPADDTLTCSVCGDAVGYDVWRQWTRTTPEWVTAEQAAAKLGVSVQAVWQRAKRQGWRKKGAGRAVRYHASNLAMEGSAA